MRGIRISDDDNFTPKDGFILAVILIGAILFAAAVHNEKYDKEKIILEATKTTSQVTTQDTGSR